MNNHTPSTLHLSRQDLPTLRNQHVSDNLPHRSAYILRENSTFIALSGFGASAPADQLYGKPNITVAETIKVVDELL